MAARKKKGKTKKTARGKGKKSSVNVVVGSKVKEAVKGTGLRCSGDLVDALNTKVHGMLQGAAERCRSNNRGTVRPQDL